MWVGALVRTCTFMRIKALDILDMFLFCRFFVLFFVFVSPPMKTPFLNVPRPLLPLVPSSPLQQGGSSGALTSSTVFGTREIAGRM